MGSAQDELPLPFLPWSQFSWGPLEFRRSKSSCLRRGMGMLYLEGFLKIFFLWERDLEECFSRIFISFSGHFYMLMHQNECTEENGIVLWSALLFHFYLGSVWLSLSFCYLFLLLHLSLGVAGTNGVNWVSVLYFPDEGDLSCVFSG